MTAADALRRVPAEARAGLRARAAREPLRGLRAVPARVTLTRVLAAARVREGQLARCRLTWRSPASPHVCADNAQKVRGHVDVRIAFPRQHLDRLDDRCDEVAGRC